MKAAASSCSARPGVGRGAQALEQAMVGLPGRPKAAPALQRLRASRIASGRGTRESFMDFGASRAAPSGDGTRQATRARPLPGGARSEAGDVSTWQHSSVPPSWDLKCVTEFSAASVRSLAHSPAAAPRSRASAGMPSPPGGVFGVHPCTGGVADLVPPSSTNWDAIAVPSGSRACCSRARPARGTREKVAEGGLRQVGRNVAPPEVSACSRKKVEVQVIGEAQPIGLGAALDQSPQVAIDTLALRPQVGQRHDVGVARGGLPAASRYARTSLTVLRLLRIMRS